MTVNKAILLGNLGSDPEIHATEGRKPLCVFTLATNRSGASADSTPPEWHRIVTFGIVAENCAKYLRKGREVFVEGSIQSRRWKDAEGKERVSNQILANVVQFIGARKEEKELTPTTAEPVTALSDEEIPF